MRRVTLKNNNLYNVLITKKAYWSFTICFYIIWVVMKTVLLRWQLTKSHHTLWYKLVHFFVTIWTVTQLFYFILCMYLSIVSIPVPMPTQSNMTQVLTAHQKTCRSRVLTSNKWHVLVPKDFCWLHDVMEILVSYTVGTLENTYLVTTVGLRESDSL